MTDEAIIDAILRREGSAFTNRPEDRGGPTKWGITLATLKRWRGPQAGRDALEDLSEAEARTIYRRLYLERPGFDRVRDESLRGLLVDAAVLHGQAAAVRWLQASLGGVAVDGVVGPATLRAVDALDEHETRGLRKRFLARRYRAFAALVARDPAQAVFLEGWVARANEFLMEL